MWLVYVLFTIACCLATRAITLHEIAKTLEQITDDDLKCFKQQGDFILENKKEIYENRSEIEKIKKFLNVK